MHTIADFEKLILQLGRDALLIPYSPGHYVKQISDSPEPIFVICQSSSNKEHCFKTKKQLSLILNKMQAFTFMCCKAD
jgi:hypothetical protein